MEASKFVQLNFDELSQLADKYETKNELHSEPEGLGDRDRDKTRKANKRPDRQIFKPNVERNRHMDNSEEGMQWSKTESEAQMDTEKRQKNVKDIETRGVEMGDNRTEEEKRNSPEKRPDSESRETRKDNQNVSPSSTEKRKKKRPDVLVYVPKARLQQRQQEQELQHSEPQQQGSVQPKESLQHPMPSANVAFESITITARTDDNGVQGPSRQVQISHNDRQNRGTMKISSRQRRQRQDSTGSVEFIDDMAWDYQVEMEAHRKMESSESLSSLGQRPPGQLLGDDPALTMEVLEMSSQEEEFSDEAPEEPTQRRRQDRQKGRDSTHKSRDNQRNKQKSEEPHQKQLHSKNRQQTSTDRDGDYYAEDNTTAVTRPSPRQDIGQDKRRRSTDQGRNNRRQENRENTARYPQKNEKRRNSLEPQRSKEQEGRHQKDRRSSAKPEVGEIPRDAQESKKEPLPQRENRRKQGRKSVERDMKNEEKAHTFSFKEKSPSIEESVSVTSPQQSKIDSRKSTSNASMKENSPDNTRGNQSSNFRGKSANSRDQASNKVGDNSRIKSDERNRTNDQFKTAQENERRSDNRPPSRQSVNSERSSANGPSNRLSEDTQTKDNRPSSRQSGNDENVPGSTTDERQKSQSPLGWGDMVEMPFEVNYEDELDFGSGESGQNSRSKTPEADQSFPVPKSSRGRGRGKQRPQEEKRPGGVDEFDMAKGFEGLVITNSSRGGHTQDRYQRDDSRGNRGNYRGHSGRGRGEPRRNDRWMGAPKESGLFPRHGQDESYDNNRDYPNRSDRNDDRYGRGGKYRDRPRSDERISEKGENSRSYRGPKDRLSEDQESYSETSLGHTKDDRFHEKPENDRNLGPPGRFRHDSTSSTHSNQSHGSSGPGYHSEKKIRGNEQAPPSQKRFSRQRRHQQDVAEDSEYRKQDGQQDQERKDEFRSEDSCPEEDRDVSTAQKREPKSNYINRPRDSRSFDQLERHDQRDYGRDRYDHRDHQRERDDNRRYQKDPEWERRDQRDRQRGWYDERNNHRGYDQKDRGSNDRYRRFSSDEKLDGRTSERSDDYDCSYTHDQHQRSSRGRDSRSWRNDHDDLAERHRTLSHSSTDSYSNRGGSSRGGGGNRGTARGGGIILLPAGSSHGPTMQSGEQAVAYPPHAPPSGLEAHPPFDRYHQDNYPQRGRGGAPPMGRGRGRGGGQRALYDPNNPEGSNHESPGQGEGQFSHGPGNTGGQPYGGDDSGYYPQQQYNRQHYGGPRGAHYGRPQGPYRGGRGGYNHGFQQQQQQFNPGSDFPQGGHGPDFYGEDEIPTPNSQLSPASRAQLDEVAQLEMRVTSQLQRRMRGMDDYLSLIRLKREFKLKCRDVLATDIESAHACSLDQSLWKTAYYQPIEMIRRIVMEKDESWEPHILQQNLQAILDDGTEYYHMLLGVLQKTYSLNLDLYYDPVRPRPLIRGRRSKLALHSCHLSLLCLGDLARYTEQQRHGNNYGRAKDFYEKARSLMPKNGRPYNQMAIIAMYTKKLTDAVYYFVRSLAACNPFVNGRDTLQSIFEDVRKRAEASEAASMAERKARRAGRRISENTPAAGARVEIWIAPDGRSSTAKVEGEGEEDDLFALSPIELHRRFHTSFLYVHGKLFCRVNLETADEASGLMLEEFKVLLRMPGSTISGARLLQLVTINMYAAHASASKDPDVARSNCRGALQDKAIQIGLDTFAVLAQRWTELFEEHIRSKSTQVLSSELEDFLPAVLVWMGWMTVNSDLWNPLPSGREPNTGPVLDIWQITADLCNVAEKADLSVVKFYSDPDEDRVLVILPEDTQMAGFKPMSLYCDDESYVHKSTDLPLARACLRVHRLRFFSEFVRGLEDPPLRWDAAGHCNRPVASPTALLPRGQREATERQHGAESSDEEDRKSDADVVVESESDEEGSHVADLKARKQQLEQQVRAKREAEALRARLFEQDESHRAVQITVRPRHLVPDTNCFIDHLASLQALLSAAKYQLVIPLIVITELDGLCRGSRVGQYSCAAHAQKVRARAEETMAWLNKEFDMRNPNIRSLTAGGTMLDTIAFRTEDTSAKGTNDDVILGCCSQFCQDLAQNFMPANRGDPISLDRNVVLLTDDRNLRLKAHTQNVPVKTVPAFLAWAQVT